MSDIRYGRTWTNSTDIRYTWRGDVLRVVITGDVIALPLEGWARGGFGRRISADWLLHSGDLPGPKARREALAAAIVRALDQHWSGAPAPARDACRFCQGTKLAPAKQIALFA